MVSMTFFISFGYVSCSEDKELNHLTTNNVDTDQSVDHHTFYLPLHNTLVTPHDLFIQSQAIISIFVLPNKKNNPHTYKPIMLLLHSLVRLTVFRPTRYTILRSFFKKPIQKCKFRNGAGKLNQMSVFLLRVVFKSFNFFRLFRWESTQSRVFFTADFLRIKKKKRIPHFSWRFTKLKDKFTIRKLFITRLFYDKKRLLLRYRGSKTTKISKYTKKQRIVSNRRAKSILFLLFALSFIPNAGGPIRRREYEKTSSNRGFVAALALGSGAVYQLFFSLIHNADLTRYIYEGGYYIF